MAIFGSNKKKELIPSMATDEGSRYHTSAGNYQSGNDNDRRGGGGGSPSYSSQNNSVSARDQYARPPSQRQEERQQSYAGGNGYGEGKKRSNNNNVYDQAGEVGGNGNNLAGHSQQFGGGGTASRDALLLGGRASSSSYDRSDRAGLSDTRNQELNEEDEEVEGIKQQMRFVNQESLASTRNAIRIAREAEDTGRATLDRLGLQSDRIANTERNLDMAKAHNDRAADEAKELKSLNRSIFIPKFSWDTSSKRNKEERRIQNRHMEEANERERTRADQYESRTRIDETFRNMDRNNEGMVSASRNKARGAERSRYQFEATGSDNEVEDELDDNLDEISGIVGRLKALATSAGQEVDSQNKKLDHMDPKVGGLSSKIMTNTQRLEKMK